MRRILIPLTLGLVVSGLVVGGCNVRRDEQVEIKDDVDRFFAKADSEYFRLRYDIERYVETQRLAADAVPMDINRFLEWRRREWWHLTNEMAFLLHTERENIEKLFAEAARFYGYEVANLPKAERDWVEFFNLADTEWNNLGRDVCAFVEWRTREHGPLRKDIKQFFATAGWEAEGLQTDVSSFLRWRNREYRKLVRDGRDFYAAAFEEGDKLADDFERYVASNIAIGRRIPADLKRFWNHNVGDMPPRLIDDVWRFTRWREREWDKFKRDLKEVVPAAVRDSEHLVDDIIRYRAEKGAALEQAMLDLERFFETYDREVRPLGDDVRRFWRFNIASGRLLITDLNEFFALAGPEADALQGDMSRFFSYGSTEWTRLVKRVKRFVDPDMAYGDSSVPIAPHPDHPAGLGVSSPAFPQPTLR